MYEALAQSMNAPAVWLLNQIGVDRGYQSVKDFNIPVTKKDKNLALALGGMSGGVSPNRWQVPIRHSQTAVKLSSHFTFAKLSTQLVRLCR